MTDTNPAHVEAAIKQATAIRLRIAGATLQQIADQLGYASRSGAAYAIEAGLRESLREPAEQLRELELMRCDALQVALWPLATRTGDPDLRAVDRVLRVMERRARLAGLDRPAVEDIEPWLREQARREGLDPDQAVRDAERLIRDMRLDR